MLRHSKFDAAEIEREKGVIIEEMNMYYDTPRDFIGGVYEELLYGDQPLGWDIIGRKETIRDAKRETFNGYVDHWYKPSRMVVGVGGKIGDDLHERVQELLGDMEEAETGHPEPVKVDPHDHAHVKVHTKASDQAHICLGVHSYPLEHPDRYVLQVLATVLGGGMSSRLFTEVRERRGLAYYVYGLNHSYTDAGSLYAQAGVDINRIDDAVTTVAAELRKIADEPVPADELEKAKSFAKGRFVLQLETSQGLIMFGLAARGVGEQDAGSGGDPRGDRQGDGRRRQPRRAGPDRAPGLEPRGDRAVRRSGPVREAARLTVRYLVAASCLALVAAGCGGGKSSATTSGPTTTSSGIRITVTGKYRYPSRVITAFMQGCTQGKQARENLCACVIDKLSYTISNRDFARVRAGRAVPRVKDATKRATAACA